MTEISIPFAPVAVLSFIVWIIWRLSEIKKATRSVEWTRELAMDLCFLYGLAVIYFTLFKNGTMIVSFGVEKSWNLEVLTDSFRMLNGNQRAVYIALYNIIGNIVMFIPLGILLPMLWPSYRSIRRVLAYGAGISFIIESIQYFTVGNISDIDDILFNSTGALIGIILYHLAVIVVRAKKYYFTRKVMMPRVFDTEN